MTTRWIRRAVALVALGMLFGVATELSAQATSDTTLKETLKFAAKMAKQGNWREARFRWELATSIQPDNPRILNNLAVASEILGDTEAAKNYYERALTLSERDPRIDENSNRFQRFWRKIQEAQPKNDPPEPDAEPEPSASKKTGKKAFRVVGRFSLPARLNVEDFDNILVASFLTEETELLDTNQEITKFLRSEFRKRSSLEVLEVVPPPAVPEQTVEDLLANREFWQHLGQEYGADLIVSGVIRYDRYDSSGFRDVDVISPVTGHKVRQLRFIEQEQFTYSMEVFFMDGETGGLHFRDHLQHSATYPGSSNDPLTAFYGLVEFIARDVLAVVSPRVREDTRIVFRS